MCSTISLRYAGTIHPQHAWAHPLHHHQGFHELIVVVSGAAEVVLDGRPLRLEVGDVAHYPPDQAHVERAVGDQLFELLFMGFDGPPQPASGAVVPDRQGRIRTMLRWLLDLPNDDALATTLCRAVLEERARCATTPEDELELRLRRWLRAHLRDPITVDAMAAELGLSRWHFTRRLRAATGLPPARYLERMRVDAAIGLLQATTLPLKAIATEVGLRDPYHLSRVIKRVTGRPPGALRR